MLLARLTGTNLVGETRPQNRTVYDAIMVNAPSLRPAATTVVLRDRAGQLEVLLLRRHENTPAAAGAMVFPGGGVAPEDERLKDLMNGLIQHERLVDRLGTPDAVSYLGAAVRELFEEAGLLIALDEIDADVVAQWRTAVLTGSKNFYDILSELRGPLDLENVVYFAHWRTPQQRARRFDTRFFAVKSPDNQVATCDGHETVEHHWVRPAEALERFRQGEWKLLLPTRTILDELARERDVGSVLAKWRARSTIAMTQPVEVVENGVTTVRLPD